MSLLKDVSDNFTKKMISLKDMKKKCFRSVNYYSYVARYIYVKSSLTNQSIEKFQTEDSLAILGYDGLKSLK